MIRTVGSAMVLLGSAAMGVRAYLSLGARVRELSEYSSMLEILRCEIETRLSPVDRAMESVRLAGVALRFADEVLNGLRRKGCAELPAVWRSASAIAPKEAGAVLAELSPVLGRYGAEEQGRALAEAHRRMEELRRRAESERHRSGKLYITFGICGGIAAAVLFL